MSSPKRRRMSVDNWVGEVIEHLNQTKATLCDLWEEMMLPEDLKIDRLNQSKKWVFDVLNDMVKHEQSALTDLNTRYEKYMAQIEQLRNELELSPLLQSAMPQGLYPSVRFLRDHIAELEQQKEAKIEQERYQEWLKKVEFEYNELMVEMVQLWDDCLIEEHDRNFPLEFNPETQGENDVDNLRNEVAQMKQRYAECQPLFAKAQEWKALWNEKIEMEDVSNSKDKYNNRGGALDARLKREKQLAVLVRRAFNELKAMCDEFAQKYESAPLVGPEQLRVDEHVSQIMAAHEENKALTRKQKESERKAQILQESRFGVSPTPRQGLLKVRQTPGSIKKTPRPLTRPRLILPPDTSVIEPVTPHSRLQEGPKTSTPKASPAPTTPVSRKAFSTSKPAAFWKY